MTDSTLSQAVKEAYASAPADEVIYHTIEITHPDFDLPVSVVRGFDNITAGGRNWTALPFDLSLPEASAGGSPRLMLTMDNVGPELMAALEAAAESSEPITVTYRAFLSSDLTTVVNDPPTELTLSTVSATPTTVTATATLRDIANRKFPRQVYRAEDFPGLIGG